MKALTVWRAVPPCCHAVLAQSMRAQHASNTTARANYHTHLPSFKRPAITFGQIGLATQTMEPVVRGARGTCLQTGREVALDVSSLGRPHRARPSTRRGNTLSVDGNTLSGITKLPPYFFLQKYCVNKRGEIGKERARSNFLVLGSLSK